MVAMVLTLFHTVPSFKDPSKEDFSKNIVGKEENAGNQHFLRFPLCLPTFQIQISNFKAIYFALCNAFILDKFGIARMSFGLELTLYSIDTHFNVSTTDSF